MAGEGINPFRYSSPIGGGDLVDRQAELGQLIDLAWSGNNARLVAPRRYGKTSLLRAALAQADHQGFLGVYVDFFGVIDLDDVAGRIEVAYEHSLRGPLAQWFAALRRGLTTTARLGGGPVPAQLEVSRAGREQSVLERLDLPRRVHERSGQRVMVVFDEFQDVLHAADNADGIIRSVIQHHGDAASYVFAGSHIHLMAELFGDRRRAFYAQARPINLPPLPAVALGDYVAERFAATGKGVGVALGPLLDAAVGHPQRAMLLAHILWERTGAGQDATEETWATAYDQAVAESLDGITTVWDALSTNERRVLTTIAENRLRLYATPGVPRGATIGRTVEALVDLGEITEEPGASTGYRVIDPLLAAWIRAGRGAGL